MKHITYPFKKDKYTKNKLVETIVKESECDCICNACDKKLLCSYTCTCCHGTFNLSAVMLFDAQNYDFMNYIVSCALAPRHRYADEMGEYICMQCNKCLSNVDKNIPKMPQKAIAKKLHDPGNKFLQAIREKPEFVCTCCHRWLFRRAVMDYNEKNYDMQNPIVSKTLDKKYCHPMEVIVIKGIRCAHEETVDYGLFSESDSDDSDSDGENLNASSQNVTLKT